MFDSRIFTKVLGIGQYSAGSHAFVFKWQQHQDLRDMKEDSGISWSVINYLVLHLHPQYSRNQLVLLVLQTTPSQCWHITMETNLVMMSLICMLSYVNKKILTFLGLSEIALLWLVISLHKSNHHFLLQDTAGFIREPAGNDRSWCRTTEENFCLLNKSFPLCKNQKIVVLLDLLNINKMIMFYIHIVWP